MASDPKTTVMSPKDMQKYCNGMNSPVHSVKK